MRHARRRGVHSPSSHVLDGKSVQTYYHYMATACQTWFRQKLWSRGWERDGGKAELVEGRHRSVGRFFGGGHSGGNDMQELQGDALAGAKCHEFLEHKSDWRTQGRTCPAPRVTRARRKRDSKDVRGKKNDDAISVERQVGGVRGRG